MGSSLEEKDWNLLLERIDEGKCTPFLGAGACCGTLPLASEIAREWAQEHGYPLPDSHDLPKVAQFLAVEVDDMFPKGRIAKRIKNAPLPDYNDPEQPHRVLADLPLPVYLTTNYDDFMEQALKARNRETNFELCRWNNQIKAEPPLVPRSYKPTVIKPIVFHLHGHKDYTQSIVITEDDYLDFLVKMSQDPKLLPHYIQKAMSGASLLFIGYGLADLDFRVIFRGIQQTLTMQHLRSIAVQLPPEFSRNEKDKALRYLNEYFGKSDIKVYWGDVMEFAAELRKRWSRFKGENK